MQKRPPADWSNVSELPISTGREPPQPQDWLAVQDIVRELYVVQKQPLKEVRRILERQYHFRNASERMFKSRLKTWGYLKNAKKDDWGALAILHERRKKSGKSKTVFTVRGRERTLKDLHKYIRSLNLTEEEFLGSIQDQDDIPAYIRATTPTASDPETAAKESPSGSEEDYKTSSSLMADQSWDESSPARFSLDPASLSPVEREFKSSISPPSLPVANLSLSRSTFHRSSFGINHHHSPSPTDRVSRVMSDLLTNRNQTTDLMALEDTFDGQLTGPGSSSQSQGSRTCDQLQRDLEAIGDQIISPAPLSIRYGSDDIGAFELVNLRTPESSTSSSPDIEFLCSRCGQPSSLHFRSLDTLTSPVPTSRLARRSILNPTESSSSTASAPGSLDLPTSTRQHDRAWKWSALCFLACIALFCNDESAVTQILAGAAEEFETMLRNEDSMLLTVAQVVASILGMHDQGEIAQRIMQSINEVCERLLPAGDPVRTIIALWTATSKLNGLDESEITSDMLKSIYDQFNSTSTLGQWHPYTIAASYAYGWKLKYEDHYTEAEHVLRETYRISCIVYGSKHLQSIFALAATAGAQLLQNKHEQAMSNFETVIVDAGLVLGKTHPYTLEGKRKLANSIRKHEKAEGLDIPSRRVEQLYWDVLVGRVKVLKRHHEYTRAMRLNYQELCEERGVWKDREADVLVLFGEDVLSKGRTRRSPSPALSDPHAAY